ncbi:hypothetical protein SGPA1_10006 [Streptomyces misionensis JCM 4497]
MSAHAAQTRLRRPAPAPAARTARRGRARRRPRRRRRRGPAQRRHRPGSRGGRAGHRSGAAGAEHAQAAPAPGGGADRALRHRGRPGVPARPGRGAPLHRPAGQDAAGHRHGLSHAVRRGGRGHLYAGHRRLGVGAVPESAAATGRGPRRSRRADRPPLRLAGLPHRRPLRAHRQHRRGSPRRGSGRDPRGAAAAGVGQRRPGHRGAVRRRPHAPHLRPGRGGPALLAGRPRRHRHRHRQGHGRRAGRAGRTGRGQHRDPGALRGHAACRRVP